jgi:hypothetical protein
MAIRIPRHTKIAAAIGAVIAVAFHVYFEYLDRPLFFNAPNAEITLRNCTDACKLYGDVTVDWDGRYRVVQKDGTVLVLSLMEVSSVTWITPPPR